MKIHRGVNPTDGHVLWDTWACDLETRRFAIQSLTLPEPTSPTAMFTALHEYAHVALVDTATLRFDPSLNEADEIAASRLALRWIAPRYQAQAKRCYLRVITRGYQRWYREEIKRRLLA